MRKHRINLRMDDKTLQLLNKMKDEYQTSYSEIITELIRRKNLNSAQNKNLLEQVVNLLIDDLYDEGTEQEAKNQVRNILDGWI